MRIKARRVSKVGVQFHKKPAEGSLSKLCTTPYAIQQRSILGQSGARQWHLLPQLQGSTNGSVCARNINLNSDDGRLMTVINAVNQCYSTMGSLPFWLVGSI